MTTTLKTKKRPSLSKRNERFWKLTPAQQRVAIAKDVIKQLQIQTIKARKGTYVGFNGILAEMEESLVSNDAAFDTTFNGFASKGTKNICDVCALGAAVVCLARLGDKLSVQQVAEADNYGAGAPQKLLQKSGAFPLKQSLLMECAFELDEIGWYRYDHSERPDFEDAQKAKSFGRKYRSSKNRLIAIYKNIIKNKGEFKP